MSHSGFPGGTLRKRRQELGVSLAELYERIHVPAAYLEALEQGDLDALPGGAYTFGFIQTYCEFLDLDAERYLDHYRGYLQRRSQAHQPAAAPGPIPGGTRPAWVSELVTWGAICGLLLFAWIAYSVIVRPFAEDPAAGVEAGTLELPNDPPVPHFEEKY